MGWMAGWRRDASCGCRSRLISSSDLFLYWPLLTSLILTVKSIPLSLHPSRCPHALPVMSPTNTTGAAGSWLAQHSPRIQEGRGVRSEFADAMA